MRTTQDDISSKARLGRNPTPPPWGRYLDDSDTKRNPVLRPSGCASTSLFGWEVYPDPFHAVLLYIPDWSRKKINPHARADYIAALKEVARVNVPKARTLFSPINDRDFFQKIVKEVPQLKLKPMELKWQRWVELERI
ncbi:MAG: hypothetical protein CL678_08185 [Bdellovibrionaceae bacterium]|nr:hypothetical protein [Pseudobdellovibrionaceae bacterium]